MGNGVNALKRFTGRHSAGIVVLAATMTMTMSGCSLTGGGTDAGSEVSSLKVMYYDERSFYDQFGTVYSALHPNVELTVVSNQNYSNKPVADPEAELQSFIERENPDVLMLSSDQLSNMAKDGKLLDLDPMLAEKDYHAETLIPGLLDYLKSFGDGKVYGLSPTFYSQALFYNKDLFAKYGIPLPQDKMTWEQLFELARRFPTDGPKDKRVYGLGLGYGVDAYQLGSMIGTAQNLTMFNPANGQITADTPSWKRIFQTAIDGLKSGALYMEDPNNMSGTSTYEDFLLRDPFVAGKLAMRLDGTYLMDQINEGRSRLEDKSKVVQNWDLVTVPVDPQNPEGSVSMNVGQIFAVNAKSANADAAKEFVRYITSEEYARVTSKLHSNGFPVRTTYLKDEENHNFKAFYALKPNTPKPFQDYDDIPQAFYMRFSTLAQQELKNAYDGKQSVDAALAAVQTKGKAALMEEQAKDKANGGGASAQGGEAGGAASSAEASTGAR
ncbi:extracellular solute-binding protein [Paenibacillus sp. MWE-103]|uniref:Extracellular solute-binding protein n=1 Tax=Paenibacillus artemisiicola TaxID=1172618 RepID=A0ABS3WD12_9BACL|nr:extracellular solute-binding protein [Paenibacillus artemisiicola]MBO7746174.1 extracellular solute-binding protein [Paenibacillus artemisiicola]